MKKVLLSAGLPALSALLLSGCACCPCGPDAPGPLGTFSGDAAFLRKHTTTIILRDGDAKVAVTPEYQGRVMTSTTGGAGDLSFGWLNYDLIKQGVLPPAGRAGKLDSHIHVFGGEDRFWIGPEGGQYSVFFKPGARFVFDDWQTPAVIDTEPFRLTEQSETKAVFERDFELVNYSGTRFKTGVRRTVALLDAAALKAALGADLPAGVRAVGYETRNELFNRGGAAWTKSQGLLSIWILGMYNPSPAITTVIPFHTGPESELGPAVNDTYFGKVPADKLVVKDGVLFFSGDGTCRSKIGLNPRRSKGIAGSYDAKNGVLNLVTCNQPAGETCYVNSMWEHQKEPYAGDVINSYNDGPPAPGQKPLGPFYELETSSPAKELKPGESVVHVSRTIHLQGSEAALDPIARQWLGAGLQEIKTALPRK